MRPFSPEQWNDLDYLWGAAGDLGRVSMFEPHMTKDPEAMEFVKAAVARRLHVSPDGLFDESTQAAIGERILELESEEEATRS